MNESESNQVLDARLNEVEQVEHFIRAHDSDPEDIDGYEVMRYIMARKAGLVALRSAGEAES